MAAKRKVAAKAAETPPVRVPAKLGTMGPESGPSGPVTIDANAPSGLVVAETPVDAKAAKAQAKLDTVAEDEGSARTVKVIVTSQGYMGKIRAVDEVFYLELGEGEKLPSWVKAVDESIPTTPLSHSAEAKEEVVDSQGIGHTTESLKKDLIQ